MDLQVILIFILALLTINLLVVGFYVVLVLKEFRDTVRKANSILENVRSVSDVVSSPVISLLSLVAGVLKGDKSHKVYKKNLDKED